MLVGTEVKSLRDGQASLVDAFATVDDGEIWLRNLHIAEYHHGSWTNHAPRRNRKLLLHRSQIDNLVGKIRDGNLTLVPLSLYFNDGKVKVELALARGKAGPRQAPGPGQAGRRTARSPANWAGAPRACPDRRSVLRAGVGAGLRRQRLRRRHRVAAGGRPAGGAGVLSGGAGAADHAGRRRRRPRSRARPCCGVCCAASVRRSACGGSTPRLGPGPISVVSPLTAILVAAVPVGVGLAMGERPGALACGYRAGAGRRGAGVAAEATDEDVTRTGSPRRWRG